MDSKMPPYILHLSKDKKLARLIINQDIKILTRSRQIHLHLCNSIMSQQLSTKVAAIIRKRFLKLYPCNPSPGQILETNIETLRSIGLSRAKANYIRNVAQFAIEHGMDYKLLGKMNNEEVIGHLIRIKGVGRWTAEMLLMFTLGREDVFAVDDLGIQQAMLHIYNLDGSNKKRLREDMLRISLKWAPFRTYACLHLWHHKDKIR